MATPGQPGMPMMADPNMNPEYFQQQPPPPGQPQPGEDLTGGLPINLDSLRDGPPGSKPFYPYSTLIRCVRLLHHPTGWPTLTVMLQLRD